MNERGWQEERCEYVRYSNKISAPCWKEMFGGVEAGTVVANPLYYQEQDNGV